MDPKRKAQLDSYYSALNAGQAPPSGVTPPSDDEVLQYSQSGTPQASRPNPGGGPMSGEDMTGIRENGTRGTIRKTGVTKGTIKRTATSQPTQYEAHGANLVRDTGGIAPPGGGTVREGVNAVQGTSGTTSGATTSGGTSPRGNAPTQGTSTPRPARSIWSEALQRAMGESGGDPRALRLPFEQHPAQVFDRYQAVAQPGYGRPVPSTMPGQPPPPPGQFPAGLPAMQRAQQTVSGAMQRVAPFRDQLPMAGQSDMRVPVPGVRGGLQTEYLDTYRQNQGNPMMNVYEDGSVGMQGPGHWPGGRTAPAPPPGRFAQPEVMAPSFNQAGPTYSPPPSYAQPTRERPESAEEMLARMQANGY